MTGIHQVIAAASPGDAITNVARELRSLLRRAGPSEVYARHIEPSLQHDICRIEEYPERPSGDVLVYHASIGEPNVHAFLLSRREPVVLVYHNVTPSSFFERWDPAFAELLDLGRTELADLRHRVVLSIADSRFNALELEAMGYRDVRVLPPMIDPGRLRRTPPSASALHHLDTVFDGPIALFVGQLLPHKRPDLLLDAMHVASTYLGSDAFLLLVGHQRLPAFTDVIRARVRELNLARVHVTGSVSEGELAAMLRRASLFVTASDHEGFCVPAVEAMAFGLPIVARACGAIPETVGDAGLLVPPAGPTALLAEAIVECTRNEVLRHELIARGRRRLADFDPECAAATLVATLLEVA